MSDRIYTLYIKTHNTTGLKYLGKCENTDVYKYKGSGRYWVRHIKKRGYDVNTKILLETTSQEEMIEAGIYYSLIYDIVNDPNWANLKIEEGDGGDTSKTPGYIEYVNSEKYSEVNKRNSERMKIENPMFDPEIVAKVFSGDIGEKISKALSGRPKTEEHKEKLRQASLAQSDDISNRVKELFSDKEFANKFKEKLKSVCDEQLNMSLEEFNEWIDTVKIFNNMGLPNSRVKRVIDKLGLTDVYYGEYNSNKKRIAELKKPYDYYNDADIAEFEEWIAEQKLYRVDGYVNAKIFGVVKYRGLLDVYYKDYLDKIDSERNKPKIKKDTSGDNNVMSREEVKAKHLKASIRQNIKKK